jgi:hypothetical protein
MKAFLSGILGAILALFGRGEAAAEYKTAEVYRGLREQVFSLKPADLGLKPTAGSVWGVIMETGYPEAVVTLVALGDGTVSLYFSNGGGIIGLGTHEGPGKAARDLLSAAPKYIDKCTRTKLHPLPGKGTTRFHLLGFDGVFTTEAQEEDFGYNRQALSPLFHKAHEVIGEARKVDEARQAEQPRQPDR